MGGVNTQYKMENQGLGYFLWYLIADLNPVMMMNTVAVLSEISKLSRLISNLIALKQQNIYKLLTSMNECTEWNKIFILDRLSNYSTKDDLENQCL